MTDSATEGTGQHGDDGTRLKESCDSNGTPDSTKSTEVDSEKDAKDTSKGDEKKDEDQREDEDEGDVEDEKKNEVVCVECEFLKAIMTCPGCGGDVFCPLCFVTQHRKGSRLSHLPKALPGFEKQFEAFMKQRGHVDGKKEKSKEKSKDKNDSAKQITDDDEETELPSVGFFTRLKRMLGFDTTEDDAAEAEQCLHYVQENALKASDVDADSVGGDAMVERAKYIPLRLTYEERKVMRLLEATLDACSYTDDVDAVDLCKPEAKNKRANAQIKGICSVLTGILVGADERCGRELEESHDYSKYAKYFRAVFEIGRRYKIMNPEKMRTVYAKLMYLLQDSMLPHVRDVLDFDLVAPLVTVYSTLEKADALGLLREPEIGVATGEILSRTASGKMKSSRRLQVEISAKNAAIEKLSKKYASKKIDREKVRQCMYSISDNNCFLRCNRDPINRCIAWLKELFPPNETSKMKRSEKSGEEDPSSLAIFGGEDGARLTHTHADQYLYVMQSLTLWSEIQHNMYKLWCLAEEDLLCMRGNKTYQLQQTGQGIQRVQQAPQVFATMQSIVQRTQNKVGRWIGSSVIHLGDVQVPNAFLFIDKYTQVPRILTPISLTLDKLQDFCENARLPAVQRFMKNTYGSFENARRIILRDFFTRAFDGSGADNFFDAGSCIDGRLTSAWQWCTSLETKPFFYLFLLAGYVGFDGGWK